jgi:hypothetical protein
MVISGPSPVRGVPAGSGARWPRLPCTEPGNLTLALGLLAGRSRPDKASQHLPDLNRARPAGNHRIARGEGPQVLFVVGLHNA